jgi:hypothetical protein
MLKHNAMGSHSLNEREYFSWKVPKGERMSLLDGDAVYAEVICAEEMVRILQTKVSIPPHFYIFEVSNPPRSLHFASPVGRRRVDIPS